MGWDLGGGGRARQGFLNGIGAINFNPYASDRSITPAGKTHCSHYHHLFRTYSYLDCLFGWGWAEVPSDLCWFIYMQNQAVRARVRACACVCRCGGSKASCHWLLWAHTLCSTLARSHWSGLRNCMHAYPCAHMHVCMHHLCVLNRIVVNDPISAT